MKKLKTFLLAVAIATGGYYFYSQQTNKIIDGDIYILNNKVYSVLTNKKVSGYILSKTWGNTIYKKYINGVISSEKEVDENSKLVSEKNFNKLGLLEGKSFIGYKDVPSTFTYKNNILNGQSEVDNMTINFTDGASSGENTLVKTFYKNINYINGVPDFLQLEIPSSDYPKKLLSNTFAVPEKYTGGIFTLQPSQMTLSEYENGILKRERLYEDDTFYRNGYGLVGLKFRDQTYYDSGKLKQIFEYRNGLLEEVISLNEKEERDGLFFKKSTYSYNITVRNYENGTLNGKCETYLLDKNKNVVKVSGFYKNGVYSGQRLNENKIENFLNGFRVENLNLDEVLNDKMVVVEHFKGVLPDNFTGFNRKYSNPSVIDEYKNGQLIKEYSFNQYLEPTIKEFKEDGGYTLNTYNFGVILTQKEFDKFGVENGDFTEYFYNGPCTKTTGKMVNGEIVGETTHYHGDRIISNPSSTTHTK